ncbi:MAG: hypothetical protein ACLFS1_11195 [Opitutales bacterium]
MRISAVSLLLLLGFAQVHAQANIEVGDKLETTLKQLGEPVGTIELRDKTVLLYPQGEVEVRDGQVLHADLMSAEEFAQEQKKLDQQRQEWAAERERQAEAWIEKGRALKQSKMSSSTFAAWPAKDRVDFWRSFQIRYPDIDVSEQLARALESYQTEREELKIQERIAELEARVARAEKEATQARLEAKRLREELESDRQSRRYGLRYVHDGPTHPPHYLYRTPKITIYTDQNGARVIHTHRGRSD